MNLARFTILDGGEVVFISPHHVIGVKVRDGATVVITSHGECEVNGDICEVADIISKAMER